MAIEVRPALVHDLPAVRRLLAHLHDPPHEVAWSTSLWARIVSDPNRAVLLAFERGEYAVGTTDVLIVPNLTAGGAPRASVENVVVDPAYRRRGVGRALMRQAIRTAADAGSDELQLASSMSHVAAHGFYEALGFERGAVGSRLQLRRREGAGAA
jgi:ribosomal protein S18 acetylase RimI-like enzyme